MTKTVRQWQQDLACDLQTDRTLKMLERDPYWPKWDAPWWKLCLLDELGGLDLLPADWLARFLDQLDTHYLHTFPLGEEELPAGLDPYREILCFCALGTILRIAEEWPGRCFRVIEETMGNLTDLFPTRAFPSVSEYSMRWNEGEWIEANTALFPVLEEVRRHKQEMFQLLNDEWDVCRKQYAKLSN